MLVGMMGSGKSSVGREIAKITGRKFVDTDILVRLKVARPIAQFFAIYGEEPFRDLETSVLRAIEPGFEVLATGGGIVLRNENWVELKRIGTVFYLSASPETLARRLSHTRNRRPLLQSEDWEERLAAIQADRAEHYKRADHVVAVEGKDIVEIANEIIEVAEGA